MSVRVALYFDGKNHMKDLHRSTGGRWIDHGKLAEFVVEHVGGDAFQAAYYYTGIPKDHLEQDKRALTDLLDEIERRAGFFIRRFPRRPTTRECPHCNGLIAYTEEKQVDTSLVADLILHTVRDNFDIAVIFSGDVDLAPGIEAVHAMGKKAYVATFGTAGRSRGLRGRAWDFIDLSEHLDKYAQPDLGDVSRDPLPSQDPPAAPRALDAEVFRELKRAEAHFGAGGGFVGAHYFVHRWKGHNLPDGPEDRRQACERLIKAGLIETYDVDGKTALRTLGVESVLVSDD